MKRKEKIKYQTSDGSTEDALLVTMNKVTSKMMLMQDRKKEAKEHPNRCIGKK